MSTRMERCRSRLPWNETELLTPPSGMTLTALISPGEASTLNEAGSISSASAVRFGEGLWGRQGVSHGVLTGTRLMDDVHRHELVCPGYADRNDRHAQGQEEADGPYAKRQQLAVPGPLAFRKDPHDVPVLNHADGIPHG